jgi:hypothetical protein
MEVSSQPEALAALPWGRALNTLGQESGWAPEPVWILWRRENWLLLPVIETRSVGRPVHFLANVLTEISWLFCVFKFAESRIWSLLLAPRERGQVSTRNAVFGCVRIPDRRYYNDVRPFVTTKVMHESARVILGRICCGCTNIVRKSTRIIRPLLEEFHAFLCPSSA